MQGEGLIFRDLLVWLSYQVRGGQNDDRIWDTRQRKLQDQRRDDRMELLYEYVEAESKAAAKAQLRAELRQQGYRKIIMDATEAWSWICTRIRA